MSAKSLAYLLVLVVVLSSCKQYDNFTTLFNTYYNANRLLEESEDEFEYQEEKKRVQPRSIVPEPELEPDKLSRSGVPPFLQGFIVSKAKRQPVNIKLDSVIIKGSKILSYHPKSDYVERTLFLMAKAYFYREEWLPSQIKCSELIDKYPAGDFSPDAHLLMSIDLLVQQKLQTGKTLLSRTVDIAWQKKRYDILSEAFRLEAELALYEDNLEEALKPYSQAIAQADDNEYRAKWQVDLAMLLFRMRKFERAEKEFEKVFDYSPDYLAEFEAKLYRADCLIRLDRPYEAEKILNKLDDDGKFDEWDAHIFARRLQIERMKGNEESIVALEKKSDSLYSVNPAVASFLFERALDKFRRHDYAGARIYFSKARTVKTPIYNTAEKMFQLLNSWDKVKSRSFVQQQSFANGKLEGDVPHNNLAADMFELGRIHSQLGNPDSALFYYKTAVDASTDTLQERARYMYVYAFSLKQSDLRTHDSIMDVIVNKYPKTEYAQDAMQKLGYTKAFIQDSVAELFNSGSDLMKFGDYPFAIKQFNKLHTKYPESAFAPRALYSVGWLYERKLKIVDSALVYYRILVNEYPNSIYAKDIQFSLDYKTIVDSGQPIPDSMQTRNAVIYQKKEIPLTSPTEEQLKELQKQQKAKKPGDDSWEDMFKPKNILKKAQEMIETPVNDLNKLKNLKPTDLGLPGGLLPADSTGTKTQPIEIKENKEETVPKK